MTFYRLRLPALTYVELQADGLRFEWKICRRLSNTKIICVDLCPIKSIPGVTSIQWDITTQQCRTLLRKELSNQPWDVVLNDGWPNVGSAWIKDWYVQNELVLHWLKLWCDFLRPKGTFVTKVFRSKDYTSLLWVFQQLFSKVEQTKPSASRGVS